VQGLFQAPSFWANQVAHSDHSDHSVLVPLDHVDHVDTCGDSAKSRKLVKVLDLSWSHRFLQFSNMFLLSLGLIWLYNVEYGLICFNAVNAQRCGVRLRFVRVEFVRFARLELLVKSATQIQTAWRRRVQMGKYKAQHTAWHSWGHPDSKDKVDTKSISHWFFVRFYHMTLQSLIKIDMIWCAYTDYTYYIFIDLFSFCDMSITYLMILYNHVIS
jgi:hypothetical protein